MPGGAAAAAVVYARKMPGVTKQKESLRSGASSSSLGTKSNKSEQDDDGVDSRHMFEPSQSRFPRVVRLVNSKPWENGMAFLIIANVICIGWQAEQRDPQGITKSINTGLELFFTGFFTLELILLILAFGCRALWAQENRLDVFLVALSILSVFITYVITPLTDGATSQLDILRKFTVLRTLRLVRIARAVRLRPEFKEMWALMKGVTECGETLSWTYVMMAIVLYFFAIMATSLIGKQEEYQDHEEAGVIAKEYFGDVLLSMFTLFQIMTLDSWTSIVRPLMKVQPAILLFFIFFISIAVFVLMNLVTAVIVEHAFSGAKDEAQELAARMEAAREQELEELQELFEKIDESGDGRLSKQELFSAVKRRRVRQKLRAMDIMTKDISELWDILDDGDGELEAEEFINGIRRLRGEAKAKDILRLERELRGLERSCEEMNASLRDSEDRMRDVEARLQTTRNDVLSAQRTMARAKEAVKLASKSQPLH